MSEDHSRCPLLALPRELRVNLWELAFAPVAGADTVDLLGATSPNYALLLCCRQTHDEAQELYTDARERFWTSTHFSLERCVMDNSPYPRGLAIPEDFIARLEDIGAEALSKITHLTVCHPDFNLTFSHGIWTCPASCWRGVNGNATCPGRALARSGALRPGGERVS